MRQIAPENMFCPKILPQSHFRFLLKSWAAACESKACGQSDLTGIADPNLPIPSGPVHCPYCRQEDFYLEQDRIEFDTENGLPLIDPA
jgi:hypothetical protein